MHDLDHFEEQASSCVDALQYYPGARQGALIPAGHDASPRGVDFDPPPLKTRVTEGEGAWATLLYTTMTLVPLRVSTKVAYWPAQLSHLEPMNATALLPGNPSFPASSPGWSMVVGFEQSGEGIVYFADVKRDGEVMCRIALAGGVSSEAEARKSLSTKARAWVDEFRHREGQSAADADEPLVLREY